MTSYWIVASVARRIDPVLDSRFVSHKETSILATRLYLDMARMGTMTPHAQRAYLDYCSLATREAGSAWFDDLLYGGFGSWPGDLQDAYPGLFTWQGLSHLKQGLRSFMGMREELPVLLANRSAQLVRVAARTLRSVCLNVFITDLTWPAYESILEHELRRSKCKVTRLSIRDGIRSGEWDVEIIVQQIAEIFWKNRCDSLFLPAVSHDGIRLPIQAIIERLETHGGVRLKIVDGAQEFCQLPMDLSAECIDLYLASSHKWLGGQMPLGIALCSAGRTYSLLDWMQRDRSQRDALEDPLLRFCNEIEHETTHGFGETVNLAALFTCQGALTDAQDPTTCLVERAVARQDNARRVCEVAAESGWSPLPTLPGCDTGILLLEQQSNLATRVDAAELRLRFARMGVALTAYDGGQIRLSMPGTELDGNALSLLDAALRLDAACGSEVIQVMHSAVGG